MSDSNDSTGTMRSTTTDSTNYESNGVPEKLWLYEENIKQLYELDKTPDRKTFLDDFFNYRKKNGLYSKIPVIARRPLDVYALYCIVQKYGGFESTMKNRMWSQIARELDLPRTMTSGAFTLKLKYIRLLYQFECHKCNKPVNQAILYNESMIGENKDRYEEHQEEYHMRTSQALHRNEEYDDVIEKEKIYREALRRSTEKEYTASIRQERHDIDSLNEPLSMAHPKTSIDDHPLPSSSLSRYNSPDRRVYQTNDMSKEITDMSNKRHLSKSSSYDRDDIFRTFSVDFFEITDDMVTIKVCLNDEKYEGVLKCC